MNQQAVPTPEGAVKIPAYARVVLFAVYMATLAAPLKPIGRITAFF